MIQHFFVEHSHTTANFDNFFVTLYSGHLKPSFKNLEIFEIKTYCTSDFKQFGFQRVELLLCLSKLFENWIIQNPNIFVQISNDFWQNGSHLSGFQMIRLLDFRSHLKSRPFKIQSSNFRSPLYSTLTHYSCITLNSGYIYTVIKYFIFKLIPHIWCCMASIQRILNKGKAPS